MLKCPKCGSTDVECYDCYDLTPEENIIIRNYSGFCMDCKVELLWEEEYSLTKIINIRIGEL